MPFLPVTQRVHGTYQYRSWPPVTPRARYPPVTQIFGYMETFSTVYLGP